ncbi:Phosphatidylinositol N-acetyglucosaminlytransferase subunit P protein [Trifolium repens]|nr:Phosphatidylinositol N-acetyglucosaminlytransferase subunit P protein [Trifolium repens]
MAKRSQRFPVQYEKDQSGCMWGFISMFDFRHARFTRKLIADKRHNNKHALGAVLTKNKFEVLSNLDEEYQGNTDRGESKRLMVTTDANKLSVKKLIEEEMFVDQDEIKDQGNVVDSTQTELGSDSLKTDSKRKRKSRKKSRDMDSNDLSATLKSEVTHSQHLKQQSRDNIDLDKIMEDFCQIEHACSLMHDDDDSKVLTQSNQKNINSEELARDAIHDFVNQMILNGKDMVLDKKFLCSHELMETLQVISSDKELFLKLLQDPNSHLLRYIQELENAQGRSEKEYNSVADSNFSEQDLGNLKQTRDIVNRKHHKFFWKKVKSQSKAPINKTEVPNRIVILKPAPTSMQNSESENNVVSSLDSRDIVHYKGPSVRVGSPFSLTEIKRKLKHAIGKEKHGNHKLPAERQNNDSRGKAICKDITGMKSPNKDHFFIEKIARPMFDAVKGNKTGIHESGEKVSNIYIEAKKHLSEMLIDNGDDNTSISSRQIPKTLGRILSLPEYNFSPLGSPGGNLEHHFLTTHARLSTSDKTWEVNEDSLSPKQDTYFDQPGQETNNSRNQSSVCDKRSNEVPEIDSDSTFSHDLDHVDTAEVSYHVRDEIVAEGNGEFTKDIIVLESSSDPNGCTAWTDQNHDVSIVAVDARCSECLNEDLKDNQQSSPLSSPSHSSITEKIEELESCTDVSGRPSPVSVLDIPFSDDDSGYSTCQPVKLRVQPLQIRFEEQDCSSMDRFHRRKSCLEENELIYDYINAVFHAASLTQDQLLMKCLSSDNILDPSLFDQVEFFSNMLCHEQKLLFDCINEVLMEVCWNYFGVSPWVSFVNPSIRPTPNMKKVILKVWEGVCWHVRHIPPPHTLEQIVRKDMARNGTWMDLRLDAETVGFEMGDVILVELMEDIILSLVNQGTES